MVYVSDGIVQLNVYTIFSNSINIPLCYASLKFEIMNKRVFKVKGKIPKELNKEIHDHEVLLKALKDKNKEKHSLSIETLFFFGLFLSSYSSI